MIFGSVGTEYGRCVGFDQDGERGSAAAEDRYRRTIRGDILLRWEIHTDVSLNRAPVEGVSQEEVILFFGRG